MEVYVGPTFTIDVSSPQAYSAAPPPSLFQLQDRGSADAFASVSSEKGLAAFGSAASLSSQSSSSIGEPGDSDDEEGEEVSSNPSDKDLRGGLGPLGSLADLEESLPVKRGLSNHFSGKSKSFVNLSEASTATAKDLAKQENPLNKKRRVLIACKWSRKSKSSFYGWHDNPKSMPLFPLGEEDEQRQEPPSSPPSSSSERDEERPASRLSGGRTLHRSLSKLQGRRSFKSASCFALSDLHCYEEDDDDKINGSD